MSNLAYAAESWALPAPDSIGSPSARHLELLPAPTHIDYSRRRRAALVAGALLLVAFLAVVQISLDALRSSGHASSLGGTPVAAASTATPVPPVPVAAAAAAAGARVYLVRPGDTLSSIARSMRPNGDVAGLARELRRLNGGSSLEVGQRLLVP